MDSRGARRRPVLAGLAFAAAAAGCARVRTEPGPEPRPQARVVVVGGGWAGLTAARELKRLAGVRLEVLLVEREDRYVSCPQSNLVLSGTQRLEALTRDYRALRERGVQVLNDEVVDVDPGSMRLTLRKVAGLRCDLMVLAPGLEPAADALAGADPRDAGAVSHAWRAGPQTVALRRRLEALPDGGTVVLTVPPAPFSGPAAPYERATLIAAWLRRARPRARVVVLDANPEPVAMPDGFAAHWGGPLRGRLIYRPNSPAVEVDARARTVVTRDGDRVRADLINVVPAQQAATLLRGAGLVDARSRWARVAWDTLESVHAPGVHVLGDATLASRGMAKSAGLAAEHGRVAAAAIVARLEGRAPAPPELRDEGFAHVDERSALRYTTRLRWSTARRTLVDDGADGPDAEPVDARRAQRTQQQALDALFG